MQKTVKKIGIALAVVVPALVLGTLVLREYQTQGGAVAQKHGISAPAADQQSPRDASRPDASGASAVPARAIKENLRLELSPPLPVGNATDVYLKLKSLAEAGDHRSAYLLFVKLEQCWRVSQGSYEGRDDPSNLLDECAGVTEEQFKSAAKLIEKAAAAGLPEAQFTYASNPHELFTGPLSDALRNTDRIVEYKKNAFQYLTHLASRGSVDAMSDLAILYRRGGLGEKDPVKAYAYKYASEKASSSSTTALQRYTEGLSSSQLQQGRMQGEAIYQACCGK